MVHSGELNDEGMRRNRLRAKSTFRRGALSGLFVAMFAVILIGCASPSPERPDVSSVPVPSAEPKVTYGTRAEQAAAHAQCMRDAGWSVEMGADGRSYKIDNPPEQADQVDADSAKCTEQIGVLDQGFSDPAKRRDLYEIKLARRLCLENAGWTMSAPPSFESFEDGYIANGYFSWDPTIDIPPLDSERAAQLCPDTDKY